MAKKSSGDGTGTGKRLSDEDKLRIATAPKSMTNTALAVELGTTTNTVARHRAAAALVEKPSNSQYISTDGDFVIIRVPKQILLRQAMSDIFNGLLKQ